MSLAEVERMELKEEADAKGKREENYKGLGHLVPLVTKPTTLTVARFRFDKFCFFRRSIWSSLRNKDRQA